MGKGGDATVVLRRHANHDGSKKGNGKNSLKHSSSVLERLQSLTDNMKQRDRLRQMKSDLLVLKSIWFKKLADGDDHKQRLEQFYGPQAHAYDAFRSKFLWGRRPMLAACAARLPTDHSDMVWVDLGGGTGENVAMMQDYIDLSRFKHIYVVDLCGPLCEQARRKVSEQGWSNVTVVEGDATRFVPPEGIATLVTFSYSLSMIPPFHAAIDRAVSYLDRQDGLLGVADFFTSNKYDLPLRQMNWARRFFWRSVFDTDNIDIGPERRNYLDHELSRVWEFNDQGSIPWVPYFRAPYYVWVGRIPKLETLLVENKVEAPALFPPTFLYTQSWEDPRTDEPHLQINEDDVCLTLTSGGCNSLALCIHGAKAVYSVDCNPAQSALLELKRVAIRQLEHDDVWALFGDGKHPRFESIFERSLAPFLSETSLKFWRSRTHYFRDGLYYQGGMGSAVWVAGLLARLLGMGKQLAALATAATLEQQQAIWSSMWLVQLLSSLPAWLLGVVADVAALLLFNRVTLWFGGGIPLKQMQLIRNDGVHMSSYAARTFDGVAMNSLISNDNYFYLNCILGKFSRNCCPEYLSPEGFAALKNGRIRSLHVVSSFFMPTLKARMYTKVILMDHLDWMCSKQQREMAVALGEQVVPGGRVIWRSAALCPPYAKFIEDAGFEVRCLQRADQGYMDRVNMYSSFYLAIRKPKLA